jgi:hypothetical protein
MPVARGGDDAAVWDGTEMLIVGGTSQLSMNAEPLARGVAYDPPTNEWRWLAPMSYARSGFVAAWAGDRLVLWGGTGKDRTIPPHGETYDPVTNAWSALPKGPIRARTDAVALWDGNEVLIWAGRDARTERTVTDGAALTPAAA